MSDSWGCEAQEQPVGVTGPVAPLECLCMWSMEECMVVLRGSVKGMGQDGVCSVFRQRRVSALAWASSMG